MPAISSGSGLISTIWRAADYRFQGTVRAMRNYRERYRYDSAGNILELAHTSGRDGRWHRRYEYDEIEFDNRLSRTIVGQETDEYAYDVAGNINAHAASAVHGVGFQEPALVHAYASRFRGRFARNHLLCLRLRRAARTQSHRRRDGAAPQ
jgi:hypothetical protein